MCSSTGSSSTSTPEQRKYKAYSNNSKGMLSRVMWDLPEFQKLYERKQRANSLSNINSYPSDSGGVMK